MYLRMCGEWAEDATWWKQGNEMACKRATDDPERRSCFDVAVAVALFHFLRLALASSITWHDTTVTVIIV